MIPTVLPLKVKNLACDMFAGKTGFSGPQITGFFAPYSDKIIDYWDMSPQPSRKIIFDECLKFFPLDHQKRLLLELCDYDGDMKHDKPSAQDVSRLKQWLTEDVPASREVDELLRKVNIESIRDCWNKALQRLSADPEGAITSARAMVESTCKSILEQRKIPYANDGDLNRLYKETAKVLALSPEKHTEQIFKQITGGLASIVNGFAALRNEYGDAHGKGRYYVKPELCHARLAVNMAGSLCLFLLESSEKIPEK